MEIAITDAFRTMAPYIGAVLFAIGLVFVYRTFYAMRIKATENK